MSVAGHIEATSMGVPQGGPLSPVLPLPEGVAIVLGELCAAIVAGLAPGEPCVVIGWPLGVEGRKRLALCRVRRERAPRRQGSRRLD